MFALLLCSFPVYFLVFAIVRGSGFSLMSFMSYYSHCFSLFLNVSFFILFFVGSDMELDLLAAAETESDSESNHSNQDNASGRRSVVTAATAGSEAGMLPHLMFNLAV